VLNAGTAILVGGKVDDLESGVRNAEEVIDSGVARDKLRAFAEFASDMSRVEGSVGSYNAVCL